MRARREHPTSCPTAVARVHERLELLEALLGEVAARDDVFAVSFHMNYWNYLDWKDPFPS